MSYPYTRPRRTRSHAFSRRLNQEVSIGINDLIYPVFISEATTGSEPVPLMPDVAVLGESRLMEVAEDCVRLGINAIALFPRVSPDKKSNDGAEAYSPQGLVQRRIRALRSRFPLLGIIADVALDPYTQHGHDGICNADGEVLNDETVGVLVRQALSLAEAGAPIVAPSDMMDGRVGAIRAALEKEGHVNTMILSYAVKYASSLYQPFRSATASSSALQGKSKESYQMHPSMRREAVLEASLDCAEGADMLMVKPALPYLDVLSDISQKSDIPVYAYQVSGEYAMLVHSHHAGALDLDAALLESLTAIKRSGARAILSYGALRMAQLIKG